MSFAETVTLHVGKFLLLCVLCVLGGLRYRSLTAKGAKTAKQSLIIRWRAVQGREWLAQECRESGECAEGEALCDEARIRAAFAGTGGRSGRSMG